MPAIHVRSTALFALSLVLAAPMAWAQEPAVKVATLLAKAEAGTIAEVFSCGYQASALATESNTDPLRDMLVAAASNSGPKGKLAAAVALSDLRDDATYGKDIHDLLAPLAKGDDVSVRAASMTVLGDSRLFNRRVLPDVQKLVEQCTKDELVPPEVRTEAAQALWRVGTNEQRGTAKDTLTTFLGSTDRELQVRGALALAEINTASGRAFEILREIRNDPTESGRRANLYLKREEERRAFEQALAKLAAQKDGKQAPAPADASQYRMLDELRQRVKLSHIRGSDITDEELVEYAAKGMLSGLDPHSTFFTSEEFSRFFFDLNREYGGIGAFVNFDQDGDFSIVRPIYSGPAHRMGLLSGDKILEVDGWETAGHTSEEIITRLKGRPDSTVALKVFRPGWTEPQEISVIRQQIQVPSVNWTMLPGNVAYVELINFSANTNDELDKALNDAVGQGARGLVLDVRNNTGGYLAQARDVVEKFVAGRKLVVYTQGPTEDRRNYSTRDRASMPEIPMAVLTNNFSASASEILAGALKDHNRAVLIGERTYGKGSVQNMMALDSMPGEPFEDLNQSGSWEEGEPFTDQNGNKKFDVGAHIKLTVARYYLPSGHCPHKEFDKDGRIVDPNWGVVPDIQLEVLDNKPEDAWKNAAVFALLKKNVFRDYVKKHLQANKELFLQLAEGDKGDASRYPEFDAFYDSLGTQLTKEDVRKWLRYEVRDQVADLRSKVYPGNRALGDLQEDAQLQEAVRQVLKKSGVDIRDIAEYRDVLKIGFGTEQRTGAK